MSTKFTIALLCCLLHGYSYNGQPPYTPQDLKKAIESADKFTMNAILDAYPHYINTISSCHTPLFTAIASSSPHNVPLLQHLLTYTSINVNQYCFRKTPLIQALHIPQFPGLTEALLNHRNTDVNKEDDNGRTPLGVALTFFIYADSGEPIDKTRCARYRLLLGKLISCPRVSVNQSSVFYCRENNCAAEKKMSPLEFTAVERGHGESTKMLLQRNDLKYDIVDWQRLYEKVKKLYDEEDEKYESERKHRMEEFMGLCQSQARQVNLDEEWQMVDEEPQSCWHMIDADTVTQVTQGVDAMTLSDGND